MKFTALQAARAAGLTYRQLDAVVRSGLVTPSYGGGDGRGDPRRFSQRDLLAFRLIRDMRESGSSLRLAGALLEFVQRGPKLPPFDKLDLFAVWTDGRQVTLLEKGKDTPVCSSSRSIAYIVNLSRAAQHVRASLARTVRQPK